MRFQVPQFTEIEDKIFGPLTFKQFIYLAGGGGILFVLYALLPFWLMIIFGIPIAVFAFALAFYQVNNQPFLKVVENAFYYFLSNKLYLWRKTPAPPPSPLAEKPKTETEAEVYAPKLTKNKLSDLAWSLDIREKLNR